MAAEPDTSGLVERASRGDASAVRELLARHRNRLRRMVSVHMDNRLSARIDPSDVVQDVMLEASRKLPAYLKQRPVAFYPWLREMAWQRLVHLRQRHLVAQKRSVLREQHWGADLTDKSAAELASRLVSSGTKPQPGCGTPGTTIPSSYGTEFPLNLRLAGAGAALPGTAVDGRKRLKFWKYPLTRLSSVTFVPFSVCAACWTGFEEESS